MKKSFVLFCALFVLLLAGCEEPSEQISDTSSRTAVSSPADLKISPEDRSPANWGADFVETEAGLYYGSGTISGNETLPLIYFCPRGGDSFYPLCSKPDCAHNDENCDAWYGTSFGYYNGALYYATHELGQIKVYQMNLDGTDHRLVASVDTSKSRCGFSSVFHHGKLIMAGQAMTNIPEEEQQDHLIVLDLSDYTQTEPAEDFLRTARLLPPFLLYDQDKVYTTGSADRRLNYSLDEEKLIEVDLVSGEVRTPLDGCISGLYITDPTWYYFQPDTSALDPRCENANPGFREYDPERGTIRECGMPADDILWARYDEDYIYAGTNYRNTEGNRTLYILSRDYQLFGQMEMKNMQTIAAVTSDRIYFSDDFRCPINCYLDKSDIGSHALELKPIEYLGLPGQN